MKFTIRTRNLARPPLDSDATLGCRFQDVEIDLFLKLMAYTIQTLAKLAGISVRTLHHYDTLGLLQPTRLPKNGYRQYGEPELLKLQQILFYRELEFPLEEIKKILDDPRFDAKIALHEHKRLLLAKRKRLDQLVKTIDTTLTRLETHTPMNNEELYDAFKDEDVRQYQEEVKARWGNTDAYKQSIAKVNSMTKQQMIQLKADGKAFTQQLADNMDKGATHATIQALIEKHYQGVQFFYDCPYSVYRNLGQMYVDDPRFMAYYDNFRPGLAIFMRDAIAFYCDQKENHP
jgi:DNA-binding transcriptional MerR regulator